MEFGYIVQMIQDFNKKFSDLETLQDTIAQNVTSKKKLFNKTNSKLTQNFSAKLDRYINREILSVHQALDNLTSALGLDTKYVVADDPSSPNYEENLSVIKALVADINADVKKLNAIDFDIENPPAMFSQVGDKDEIFSVTVGTRVLEVNTSSNTCRFDKEVGNGNLKTLAEKIVQCHKALDTLETQVKQRYSVSYLENFLEQRSQLWMQDEIASMNAVLRANINDKLVKEDKFLSSENFENILSSAKAGEVDFNAGSEEYPDKITLGTMTVDYLNKKDYSRYVSESPVLSKYAANGKMTIPYVLELKKMGNLLFNIHDDEQYSDTTFNLVHNVILSYLMAFPAGRMTLNLVDFDDRGDFAKYTQLNRINSRMLCDGITRDERDIDNVIRNVEKTMRDTYDNKIVFNDVKDIFEYNNKSEGNPQSFQLLIILNFPRGFTRELSDKLLKIIDQGNRSGIYTVILNNTNIENRNIDIDAFLTTAKKNMDYFEVSDDKIIYDNNSKYEFTPTEGIKLDDAPRYMHILQTNAKRGAQRVVKLEKMLDNTDALKKAGEIEDYSLAVDIPIGMRGGEIQSLEFSTEGGGSAHALAIGGTGSGKSNLLHAIILSACYKYSPEELNIFLVDFKGGVEFKFYEANRCVEKQLPHVRLTGLTSDPEDGLAILENILAEMTRRENLFRDSETEDIMLYRKKTGKILPRLLVIIDEVQELFTGQNNGENAINILSKLVKKGRAFGINILWASQTIPNNGRLKSEVLGQIGNKICLRLNNPEEAAAIDLDTKKVKELNRPEKGLGIILDVRLGNQNNEFRVAYAESSEKRYYYTDLINKKWKNVIKGMGEREPLFVVGNSEIPQAYANRSPYAAVPTKADIKSKSSGIYNLCIGQNYISGKPYSIPIALRGTRANLWMAGSNVEELRDMMGYAMLSVIMENYTNSDFGASKPMVFYINGELRDPNNPNDLFYVLPSKFDDQVKQVHTQDHLIELFKMLYKTRKERYENFQAQHRPIFVFINKLQAYAELFRDTSRLIDVSDTPQEKPAVNSSTGFNFGLNFGTGAQPAANNSKMSFAQLFNNVFGSASDLGIHFVFSIDSPSSIPELAAEMRACKNKVIIKGVAQDALMNVISANPSRLNIAIEGLGLCFVNNEIHKFKPYRYYDANDAGWFEKLANDYKNIE